MACRFFEMLKERMRGGARACVGLDPDWSKLPEKDRLSGTFFGTNTFNQEVVEKTKSLALAYKPNLGFYLATGVHGLGALVATCHYIKKYAPDVPIVLDGKFNDIGNTAKGYAQFAFDECAADAVTVNPYLGMEALEPFLSRTDKGIIVLCKTSNPGSGEFQDLLAYKPEFAWSHSQALRLYEKIANDVAVNWNTPGNCALVVGATYPTQLKKVRGLIDDMWCLVPGVGSQGGDVKAVVDNGFTGEYGSLLINSSSGIIFAKDPQKALLDLTAEINAALPANSVKDATV